MYRLKEWWDITFASAPYDGWDGNVICTESDAGLTVKTNITQGFLSCYAFTLVTQGWLVMRYGLKRIRLTKGDLYIYSPGMVVTVLDISADYRSICLMVDEFTTLESPAVRDMVSLAFTPVVQLSSPTLSLTAEQASQFEKRMREIISYQQSTNVYKDKLLRMLYAVFLVDLQNAMDVSIAHRQIAPRVEELFIGFQRLLAENYIEHRDISFYAGRLCITNDYLSRIVKQVSGRTVVDYINQLLLMESCYLLRTSSLSIKQISEQLHFAEPAAFTHFFTRLQGISPRLYRNVK